MTPVAQTNIEFYEIAHFFFVKKLPLFIKNYPPFIKKNYRSPPEKKLHPQISPFIKNSIFEIIETLAILQALIHLLRQLVA